MRVALRAMLVWYRVCGWGDERRNHVGNRAGNLAGAIFTRSTPPKWQCSSKPGYLRLRLVERAVLRRDVGPAC